MCTLCPKPGVPNLLASPSPQPLIASPTVSIVDHNFNSTYVRQVGNPCLNYIVVKFPLFLGKTSSGKEKIKNDSEKPDPESSDDNPARKLELMRERRRIIEKENKKKKELLAQTIAERLKPILEMCDISHITVQTNYLNYRCTKGGGGRG